MSVFRNLNHFFVPTLAPAFTVIAAKYKIHPTLLLLLLLLLL
jgi:hypothetical protein